MNTKIAKALLLATLPLWSVDGSSAPRTPEQALVIAQQFVRENPKLYNVRHSSLTLAPTAAAQMAKGKQLINNTPAYYICNIGNDGFVVVSGDDRFKEVLGYSIGSAYNGEELPDGLNYWLSFLSNEMEEAIQSGYEAPANSGASRAADASQSVEPLLKTTWDQSAPYNNKLAGNMTGCVATGTAQVMKYWEYPTKGTGSHKAAYAPNYEADFSTTTYDWANMLNVYDSGFEEPKEIDAVATLMLHVGIATDMRWSKTASGTINALAAYALKTYFGYNKNLYLENRDYMSLGAWKALLIDQLQTGHPICYAGRDGSNAQEAGHYFVCDGYDSTTGKFHFNWGWSGRFDGYYEITSLEPGTGGIGAGAGKYNSDQQILVNVQPETTGSPVVHYDVRNIALTANGKEITAKLTHIENNNAEENKGTIGIALYNADGTLVKYISGKSFPMSGLYIGSVYSDANGWSFNADLSSIANGTYTACVAVEMEGIEGIFPVRANYDANTYFKLDVTGSNITVVPVSKDVTLDNVSIAVASNAEGNVFCNRVAQFNVTVKNSSPIDFNDEIGVDISAGRGKSQRITSIASIPAGTTKTISVSGIITLSEKDGCTATPCYGVNGSYASIGDAITINIKPESADGIENITIAPAEGMNALQYNISGQRISDTAKGIIIQNGKKSVKK